LDTLFAKYFIYFASLIEPLSTLELQDDIMMDTLSQNLFIKSIGG